MLPMTTNKSLKIIETQSQTILREFHPSELETAYKEITEFENMGLEVELQSPGAAQSLFNELGASHDELDDLKDDFDEETSNH